MENLRLDFVSVVVAAAVESLSSILVLLGLLFLVTKGQVLKLLIFRLVVKDTIFILVSTHENQLHYH